jgi:hypothetical protein
MKYSILISFLCLLLTFQFLPAQDNTWNILQVNGDTLFNVSLQNLIDDSLLIASLIETKWGSYTKIRRIPIASIIEMKKIKKSKIGKGIGLGLLIGGAVGAGIGYATYDKPEHSSGPFAVQIDLGPEFNTLIGGIAGGTLGMIIGIAVCSGEDVVYDLSQWEYSKKVKWLRSKLPN